MLVARVTGKKAEEIFAHEAGGHRWQRIPPSEKRGRRHSSTVTVAVLREPTEAEVHLSERDLQWKACRGSGAGGQHRNVTDSAVQLTHLPTKTSVRVESERSQHQNKQRALGLLRARLLEGAEAKLSADRSQKRRHQVGTGMRSDKVRTVSLFRDQAVDHRTGKKMVASKYLRGYVEDLWD
jgi:peptide chain release factor 1